MSPGISEFLDGKLDSESERADMLKGEEYVKDAGGGQRVHKVIHNYNSGTFVTVYDDGRNRVQDRIADPGLSRELEDYVQTEKNLSFKLLNTEQEFGKAVQRLEDSKARVVTAEEKTEVLRAENIILQQHFGKSKAKILRLEKTAAEAVEANRKLTEDLANAREESSDGKKKQSQTIVNLKNEFEGCKKKLKQAKKISEDDKAVHRAAIFAQQKRHEEKIKTQKENYEAMLEKIQGDSADLSSEEEEETSLTEKFEAFKEKEGFALLKEVFKKKERRLNEAKRNAIKEKNAVVVKLDDVTEKATAQVAVLFGDLKNRDEDVKFLQNSTALEKEKADAAEKKAKMLESELKKATDMLRGLDGLEEQKDQDKSGEQLTQKEDYLEGIKIPTEQEIVEMTQDERLKLKDVVEGKMKDMVEKRQKIRVEEGIGFWKRATQKTFIDIGLMHEKGTFEARGGVSPFISLDIRCTYDELKVLVGRTFIVDGSEDNLKLTVDGLKCLARKKDLARVVASTMCTWFFVFTVLQVDETPMVMNCDRFMRSVEVGHYNVDGLKQVGSKADGEAQKRGVWYLDGMQWDKQQDAFYSDYHYCATYHDQLLSEAEGMA